MARILLPRAIAIIGAVAVTHALGATRVIGIEPNPANVKMAQQLGADEVIPVDVRIVCASKADLHGLVQGDRFLEDLYFRLLDFPLVVPPLRDRPGDIPLLARHFVQKYGDELGGGEPEIGNDVLDALSQAIDWTRDVLFRPFDPEKWIVLGFCAWIATSIRSSIGTVLGYNQGSNHCRMQKKR